MPEELITPDNLSKELLKAILDAAYLDTSYNKNGDLMVKDTVCCLVYPHQNGHTVQLMTQFGIKPEASELQRLQCANRINAEYIIVRAITGGDETLFFTWDIPIAGGITKKAFVLAFKRFCSISHNAAMSCASDVIV